MALPSFPSTVPFKVLAGSWTMPEPARPPIDTEFDGGNLRRRRRPGDDVAVVEFRIAMTREEHSLFLSWFKAVAFNGASRFNMKVWLGSNYQTKVVQFDKGFMPSASELGRDVVVSMKLRVFGM